MKIRARSAVAAHSRVSHGGRYSAGNRNPGIADFSSNISPAGTPESVKSALKRGLGKTAHYPDSDSSDLIAGLKKYAKLPESNLAVGNGAVEIIYNFCNAFLSKKRVLIPVPTFGEYEAAAKLADCKITTLKTMNLAENIDALISKIPANGCVFVCNPNNPTGTILSKRQLAKIISAAEKKSCLVFVDECFIELVPESDESVLGLVRRHDNLFVLRSLTKSFGLAGIRVGYAAASRQIISILQRIQIPWSVNALAQEAGIAAIKDKAHLKKSNSIIKKESDFLKSRLANIEGIECRPSSTNFILIKTRQDSTKLQKKLLKHNILVRDCRNFRGLNNHYIRIAVKSRKENLKLVRAMEAVS